MMENKCVIQLSIETPWKDELDRSEPLIEEALREYFNASSYNMRYGRLDRTAFECSNGVRVFANIVVVEREKETKEWL